MYIHNVVDKTSCTGCGACSLVCGKKAITMSIDEEGFYYPKLDEKLCVHCGLCDRICPALNNFEKKRTPIENAYALQNKDEIIRKNSSSGGVFYALAKYVIEQDGKVCGVVFNDNWSVRHTMASSMEVVEEQMRSKYLQSPSFFTFYEIRTLLDKGTMVLFTGTPCQVSGLTAYLRKPYHNLIKVELCCHAVPSPYVWTRYLHEKKIIEPTSINFRCKDFGWQHYGLELKKDGHTLISEPKEKNSYMKGFLYSLYCRPSCSKCPNKPFFSDADIVIGDYWGAIQRHKEYVDGMGISLFIALSSIGRDIFEIIKSDFQWIPIKKDDVTFSNGNFSHSEVMHKNREMFWELLRNGDSVETAVKKCLKRTIRERIKNKINQIIKIISK